MACYEHTHYEGCGCTKDRLCCGCPLEPDAPIHPFGYGEFDSPSGVEVEGVHKAGWEHALVHRNQKRGYSREFTPQSDRRCRIELDRIPPTLYDAARAKVKREGVSLRALILSLLKAWLEK